MISVLVLAPNMPPHARGSFMLKLQDLWLGKQITSAFHLPSGRLLAKRYETVEEVVLKLALILQLVVLSGAALPLMTPLLWMTTLSETAVAAASCSESDSQKWKVSNEGNANIAASMVMMACYSALWHVAFAWNSPSALLLIFLCGQLRKDSWKSKSM